MLEHDETRRFLIQGTAIRGQLISLDESLMEILKRVGAQGRAALLLGESLAAISLLASTVKIDGKITLQIRGEGDLHLLVAQATSQHTIRGLIRGDIKLDDNRALSELFNSDHLVITIESGNSKPHQGIVPLEGGSIAAALKSYFIQSEQLPTQLWLVANSQGVSGLLLQQMPTTKHAKNEDDWTRVQLLADTIKDEELLELSGVELLHRLFNEDDVQLFAPQSLKFDCSCSRHRSGEIIRSVGKAEIDKLLEERDDIEIVCEFCNQAYVFDAVDVSALFNTEEIHLITDSQVTH
ncbi:MAG: Hsp33 family molecular chaperone HslO [Gammaproteobacteria bacterium]|nr:Hsp33 family molecular chaperone HslO [Gammaproteobacteria bacterium]